MPEFEIIVDDLVRQSDAELLQRPLGTLPKVVLWVLRDSRSIQTFLAHLSAWAAELERLGREAPRDARTVMRYILAVAGDQPFAEVQKRIVEVAPATESTMASAAEQLLQMGRVEGKAEGKAEAVLAVLGARGLSATGEQRARIVGCKDVAEVERWLSVAVTADRVEELFESPGGRG